MRRFLTILALSLLSIPVFATPDPHKTWVFIVGLVDYQDRGTWYTFPTRNRREPELASAFLQRGVAADHVLVLLDRQATRATLEKQFRSMLQRTQPGDFLFLYFNGHGWRGENGHFYWAPYEGTADATLWDFTHWSKDIQRYFKGSRLLVAADCCHSGALRQFVRQGKLKAPWAALSSTSAHEDSSVYWTFTDILLDLVGGNPTADLNHDGYISFKEMSQFAAREMAYLEEQVAGGDSAPGFGPDLPLFKVTRPKNPGEGKLVEVRAPGEGEEGRRARVVSERNGKSLVRWLGTYDDLRQQWVNSKWLRS